MQPAGTRKSQVAVMPPARKRILPDPPVLPPPVKTIVKPAVIPVVNRPRCSDGVAAGQIRVGDVGMPPGHIMPTSYGVIVSTMNNPGFKEVAECLRVGARFSIKLTDNNGVTHTSTVKALNADAGWYATITIEDLTKVFAQSSSIAFVVSAGVTEQVSAEELARLRARAADSGQSVQSHLFTDLGCWKDTPDRAISGGYVGSQGTDTYDTSRCYGLAMSRGHDIFALQGGYACFTGLSMRDNYKKYGEASGNCEIRGGEWVNHVYSINEKDHVVPHEVGSYSDWSVIPSLFSDFQAQSSKLLNSLKFPDTSNPAPYMTALDTNVNAIRDDIRLQEIKALNAQNVKDATQIFRDVTDMNPEFQENRAEAERLRRQILLTSNQTSGYQNKTFPLQILAVTLALVLVVYFLAGFVLTPTIASTLAIVLLAVGFGASVYYAFYKQSVPNNNG